MGKIEGIKRKIMPVLKRHSVRKAAIFGSFARGEQKKTSDIDILVKLPEEKSLFDLIGLKLDLEDILNKKVDVLTYDSIHPLLKNIILDEQKVIL
jgi:uncharacterized protein